MECLVYNVPNTLFNHSSYLADMRGVLGTIFNETLSSGDYKEWVEVSERKWLFRSTQPWAYQQAHELAAVAWNYMGFE
jgi:hypothetical protein